MWMPTRRLDSSVADTARKASPILVFFSSSVTSRTTTMTVTQMPMLS